MLSILFLFALSIETTQLFDNEYCNHDYSFERKKSIQTWNVLNRYLIIKSNGCINEDIDNQRSYEQMDINISNCFFTRISQISGNGGVICVFGCSCSMFVKCSMFHSCSCSSEGGAIYFRDYNSVLMMVCAYKCSCGHDSYCHYANIKTLHESRVEYISISSCSNTPQGDYSIYFYTGNQNYFNSNSSMNNAFQVSSILIESPSSFTSSHCTFSNNKALDGICIYLYDCSGSILFANIVHNNSPSFGVVYVHGRGSYELKYCIFDSNHDALFNVNTGSVEISHSFISHVGMTSTGINNTLKRKGTYQLKFFQSYYCNADIPLYMSTHIKTLNNVPLRNNILIFPLVLIMIH